jgi:CBS domain containing-hemolysin-like protein
LSLGGLFATCFGAIGARALIQFSRHELEEVCRLREAQSLFGEILKSHDRVARGVETLVALTSSLFLISASLWTAARWFSSGSIETGYQLAACVVGWGVVYSAARLWIPWTIVSLWAEEFLYYTWRMWRVVSQAVSPLVGAAQLFDVVLHRLAGRQREEATEESIEEEIRTIVTEGHRGGLLEEDAREMIEGVIELGDADVSQIMTPRTDMHMIHVGLNWDSLLENVIHAGHTRIPVFEKNRDDIVGVLYVKDLLPELAKRPDQPRKPMRDILRRPHFVPETKAVDDLLEDFQQTRNHMAVVLDEYGGVSGLVTIEDVLEEIVGEIVDEYDADLIEEIKLLSPHVCEALGRAHVDEVNEQLGTNLPDNGDYDTIGGFVFSELGRIPNNGETLIWNESVRVTVIEASHRRIERVRIERLDELNKEIA